MYWDHMSGWGWLTGSAMMLLWVVVLALAVYIAVRLARGDGSKS